MTVFATCRSGKSSEAGAAESMDRSKMCHSSAEDVALQPFGGTASALAQDDLEREVYCVCGMPIDVIEMPEVLARIDAAAAEGRRFLISTPNLNFLAHSRSDSEFRNSLLLSDLCPADGMPVVWLARLAGVPINGRIAGSDIFEALKQPRQAGRRLKIFIFGGNDGIAAAAADAVNATPAGMCCVGSMSPGFGSVEDLSQDDIVEAINASHADFLVVALGAKKGQAWLLRNHDRLKVPIRAHLGATINFEAGIIRRAPGWMRKTGIEWMWRIKEEPYLWNRYFGDATVLAKVIVTRALPLASASQLSRMTRRLNPQRLRISRVQHVDHVVLKLAGDAMEHYIHDAIGSLRDVAQSDQRTVIDVSRIRMIDARFLGLLLMFRKHQQRRGELPRLVGASRRLARYFRFHGADFLLS